MRNRNFNDKRRKPQLHSLIDMAFILLLFFAIIMLFQGRGQEQVIALPTPENKPGEAQIAIQIIDADTFWFLGDYARKQSTDLLAQPLPDDVKRELILGVFRNQRRTFQELRADIQTLKKRAAENPMESYFVVIRCPNDLPYSIIIPIIQELSGIPNIQYGCVGGSVQDFLTARFSPSRERLPDGSVRDKVHINF